MSLSILASFLFYPTISISSFPFSYLFLCCSSLSAYVLHFFFDSFSLSFPSSLMWPCPSFVFSSFFDLTSVFFFSFLHFSFSSSIFSFCPTAVLSRSISQLWYALINAVLFPNASVHSLWSPVLSVPFYYLSHCLKPPFCPSALGCHWSQMLLTFFNSAPTRQFFWMATNNSTKNASPCGSGSPTVHHSINFWAYKCFFHPMLAWLLGCGTAKFPSQGPPVPPWPAANAGEQNKLILPTSAVCERLGQIKCGECELDFILGEEGD